MKLNYKQIGRALIVIGLSSSTFFACSSDDSEFDNTTKDNYEYSKILENYTSKTIIPTYKDMYDNSVKLLQEAKKLETNKSTSILINICKHWKNTRHAWEQSEAFLFGPAADHKLDPSIDSWPLDKGQLDIILKGESPINASYVEDQLGSGVRGFHTIEYLIFEDGKPKGSITDRETEYLIATIEVLQSNCKTLYMAWKGGTAGEETYSSYAKEVKNAGKAGSRFKSQEQAIEQIIDGTLEIVGEVGTQKINAPYTSKEKLDVESWYSWNSLTDFVNNIQGVENVYNGGYGTNKSGGLNTIVKEKNPELDTKITKNIANVKRLISEIGEPFRNNLNEDIKIKAAMNACAELEKTLLEIKKLVVK
jgi:predicted lipoprotein